MEITIDETVANITSAEDNNDDESKRNDQIPSVSTSPSSITDMLADNGLTRLGSYEVPPPLAPSTKDPPGGGLSMNLNPSTINAVVPFAEGSASGNQGKKLEQIDPSINIYQLFEIDPSEFGVDSLACIKNITTAYHKLSRVQHPDRHHNLNDNKTANANFVIIKEAYDILKDPVKRQEYNDQNHVSNGFPILSRGIDNSKHECDHKKLDRYMQILTKNQLHMVVRHSYC